MTPPSQKDIAKKFMQPATPPAPKAPAVVAAPAPALVKLPPPQKLTDEELAVSLGTKRQEIYTFLESVGTPGLKKDEPNRLKLSKMLQLYADHANAKLKRELALATRTNQERTAARKAKAKRKAEARKAREEAARAAAPTV